MKKANSSQKQGNRGKGATESYKDFHRRCADVGLIACLMQEWTGSLQVRLAFPAHSQNQDLACRLLKVEAVVEMEPEFHASPHCAFTRWNSSEYFPSRNLLRIACQNPQRAPEIYPEQSAAPEPLQENFVAGQ